MGREIRDVPTKHEIEFEDGRPNWNDQDPRPCGEYHPLPCGLDVACPETEDDDDDGD